MKNCNHATTAVIFLPTYYGSTTSHYGWLFEYNELSKFLLDTLNFTSKDVTYYAVVFGPSEF